MSINPDSIVSTVGSPERVPGAEKPGQGAATTSFFISIGELLSSSMAAPLDKSARLLWFNSLEQRVTDGDAVGNYQASATLVHSLMTLHIATEQSFPTLRQAMRAGDNVPEMKIVRVGHTSDGPNTELYSSTYTDCKIESIEEFPDKMIVKVSVTSRSDTAASTKRDATQESASGSEVSGWDYTTNVPTA
jgi:type VI protein secretion system component Hcp